MRWPSTPRSARAVAAGRSPATRAPRPTRARVATRAAPPPPAAPPPAGIVGGLFGGTSGGTSGGSHRGHHAGCSEGWQRRRHRQGRHRRLHSHRCALRCGGPAPGLFQSSVQAVNSWANMVNSQGGIFGRKIKVDVIDSKTDAGANRAGALQACAQDFALVGSMSAYDDGGAAPIDQCGIPDLTAIPTNAPGGATRRTASSPSPTCSSGTRRPSRSTSPTRSPTRRRRPP